MHLVLYLCKFSSLRNLGLPTVQDLKVWPRLLLVLIAYGLDAYIRRNRNCAARATMTCKCYWGWAEERYAGRSTALQEACISTCYQLAQSKQEPEEHV